MNTEELEAQVKSLSNRLETIEDTLEIENLQRIYGYYMDYSMWGQFVDLFSDNTESIEVGDRGVFLGKDGVEKVCETMAADRAPENTGSWGEVQGMVIPRKFFHMIIIEQPVIDVDFEGKTAYGRWAALECAARPTGGTWIQYWGRGIYGNEYIKEDNRWRFRKFHWYPTLLPLYENGWLKTPTMIYSSAHRTLTPDRPSTFDHRYPDPEWCTVPFHYKHPLTGK